MWNGYNLQTTRTAILAWLVSGRLAAVCWQGVLCSKRAHYTHCTACVSVCADGSSLLVLNVRGNRLEGPAHEVEDCTKLVQLDLSSNMLTGSLPASTKW